MGGPSSTQMKQGASMVLHDRYHCAAAGAAQPRRLGAQQCRTGTRPAVAERGAGATRRRGGRKGVLFFLSVVPGDVQNDIGPSGLVPL